MSDTIFDMVIGALAGFLIGVWVGAYMNVSATKEQQAEAVKRGVAEWVVDPANGETSFKWKEVEP